MGHKAFGLFSTNTRSRKDGALLEVRLAAAPMYNLDGTVRNVAFAYEDITDRKIAEGRKLAHYSQPTGLANRALLQQEEFLLNENCEEAQGFLYAKPLPAEEFEAYLRTERLALLITDDHDPGGGRAVHFERRAAKSSGRRRSSRG